MKREKKSVGFLIIALVVMFTQITNAFIPFISVKAAESGANTNELFISEYIEGSSYNKAIEIYNGTGTDIDLSNYSIALYSNGAEQVSQSATLSGNLASGEVFVISHNQADEPILAVADETNSTVINFNGDDAFALIKGDTIIDVIGEIGLRNNFGKDKTLIRNDNVTSPNPAYDAAEWTDQGKDYFENLGEHKAAVEEPVDNDSTIREVRSLVGETVTVEGVVTTSPGAWGGSGFYLQDNTAGIYVFEDDSVTPGNVVRVTAEVQEYNGEIQLSKIASLDVIGQSEIPEGKEISPNQVNETNQGQLVMVKDAEISDLQEVNSYGTFEFKATKNGESVLVRVDNRIGLTYQEFGYQSGDSINITGIASIYNGIYQLKPTKASDIQASESPSENPEEEEPGDVTTIAEARQFSKGSIATIEGVITSDNLANPASSQLSVYLQDGTAGINIFVFDRAGFPELQEGDRVKLTGEIDIYNGLTEIIPQSPEDVEVLANNTELPEPALITLADLSNEATVEPLEGQLVSLAGYIQNIPESPAGGGYNISLMDQDFNGTTLRVMEGTMDVESLEEGKWYDITAILSQYNSYQLLPRNAGDIVLAEDQPEAPDASGEYTSTVEYVTDGDTIRLTTPVLGADRVRFVNIDTPETSVPGANGADEANQKEHGENATNRLKELLPEGSKVTLKIGQEPADAYGRLLAEVINEDGVNTNLQLVEEGLATTYFIWPIGDEETYQTYQNTVKTAIDAGLGIWNSENPLKELPFEYRAITEGGDFHRYVGNSDTKKYVEPAEYNQVPVEHRIFFASAEEAKAQGYTAAVGEPVGEVLDVQLLSMNDLHGKIDQQYELDINGDGEIDGVYGRMDYVAAYLKARDQQHPNSLIVHAGDMIGGSSPVSGLYQDEPTVEMMEEIGFDFGTVGNHEFDEGTAELLRMVNGGEHPEGLGTENYDGMNFANLCANCVYKDSGETVLPPYAVTEIDGEKIGFIGINTQASAGMVMPAGIEDIKFTDEVTAVNESAAALQAEGVEAIVVLAHMPAEQDGDSVSGESADLARNVNDAVDIIFAAHNHQVVNGVVDNKLIVQASEYGKAFADIDIQIDRETGDIVKKEAEIVWVDQSQIEPDSAAGAILNKYQELIEPKMNQVLGYNAQDLTGDYTNDGDHGLGNLIADGMQWAMDADFAMMNGGGIRDDLLAGEVTWGDLYNIMPFGNTLMKFEVTGEDLYTILDAQLSPVYGPDYSVAGLHYKWDTATSKVTEITLPDGTPIDKTATYTLVVNNFMGTSSGDKYRPIGELGENEEMGPVDLDAFVDYVQYLNTSEGNPLVIGPQGRITESGDEHEEDLGAVSIAEARNAAIGTKVTVEGVVTTTPGAWGGNGFYIQDKKAGIYVFGDDKVSPGDIVKVTAITGEYNGEKQLGQVSSIEVIGQDDLPKPKIIHPGKLNESNQGQLVILKGVTITELTEVGTYGTFEFIAKKGNKSAVVRVDNRTGLSYEDFEYENGDKVDVTGIASKFNDTYQLKPTNSSAIVSAKRGNPDWGIGENPFKEEIDSFVDELTDYIFGLLDWSRFPR
ncbi:2',3'-cyclic-nucleotide 2'-phosphodiesterase/5'-or 3'-nucleotidase, 5'-nucleotidase family [Gracilibacillus ureilyticus]|uniref:2',3'-cyclic-nucleotide 2'-phosphodiesterase/5'-or 3'-nucleotidase, 5'-nucleotidase family n=1 Tax=Gracilibacillus ureilyticus TaxID=531814 RepID=A0A1H9SZW9_9BACI|nr:5'-nucleotidase C-terminal domain-containing protein [Gracilibacillus ureilyticus]SER90406.1 2',3'-cyclic-nucleotide 2'-phosphodiesterase/5'-or 3'-nucleotidase, 5'-nucleotidase family [Gracilibacillus ureilyticus]